MKTRTLIWVILLVICNTPTFAEHYYYYHGERVPLIVNMDSVAIYARLTSRNARTLSDSIVISTIPIETINQLSVQEDLDILSIEYLVGDSLSTDRMSNRFYIKLHEYADTVALKALVQETNTHLIGQVPYMKKWYEVMVANSMIDNTLDMSNYFFETGLFADVDPGLPLKLTTNCVNDSAFASQWALPAINACDAWEYTIGDPNLIVAIIDQGIDFEHPEFANTRFVHPYDCHTNQEIDTLYGPHGTQVAGVILANHNFGQIAGIAPRVSIMPISHPIDPNPVTTGYGTQLAKGINYAVEHGADIINCSWGSPWKGTDAEEHLKSSMLENALEDALKDGRDGKGCIVVFGAGNGKDLQQEIYYPGNQHKESLVVGAINSMKRKVDAYSFGNQLDVVAPGDGVHTTILDNGYDIVNGTSFAAPYVSGIAALILSVRPDLTREEVVDIIESTARNDVFSVNYSFKNKPLLRPNGPWCEEVGYGLVDAHAAVSSVASIYIQDQTYKNSVVERAHSIYAGYSVTDTQSYGNVILKSGSDVTYHTTNKVVIKSGFHAEKGSRLHIKADNSFFDPITTTVSAPQRLAPRSSSVPADNTEPTDEGATSNSLENIESDMIQSTAIYTISGQLLQTIEGGQRDAAHLPNGMYILQHRMSDGSMRSEKIANNK